MLETVVTVVLSFSLLLRSRGVTRDRLPHPPVPSQYLHPSSFFPLSSLIFALNPPLFVQLVIQVVRLLWRRLSFELVIPLASTHTLNNPPRICPSPIVIMRNHSYLPRP